MAGELQDARSGFCEDLSYVRLIDLDPGAVAIVRRLLFKRVAGVPSMDLPPPNHGAYARAEVRGWGDCVVEIFTWRDRAIVGFRGLEPLGAIVFGEGVPTLMMVIGRYGHQIDTAALRAGVLAHSTVDTLLVSRPRFGLLPSQRAIRVQGSTIDLLLEASPPISTRLVRPDGSVVARYWPWGTYVDSDASALEMAVVLLVIAQRLSLWVVSLLPLLWNLNIPRAGGVNHVL